MFVVIVEVHPKKDRWDECRHHEVIPAGDRPSGVVCAVTMPRPPLKTGALVVDSRVAFSREARLQVLSALDPGNLKLWRDS
jgi:hypothetical protein